MNEFFIARWWLYFCIFFSNYVIVYVVSYLFAKNKNWNSFIKLKIYPLLPLAYALVATCFWIISSYRYGFDYISKTIMAGIAAKLIITWSLSALVFWLPVFRKKIYFSLLHSIPFFILPFVGVAYNIFRLGILELSDVLNILRMCAAGLLIYAVAIIILQIAKRLFLRTHSPKHNTI